MRQSYATTPTFAPPKTPEFKHTINKTYRRREYSEEPKKSLTSQPNQQKKYTRLTYSQPSTPCPYPRVSSKSPNYHDLSLQRHCGAVTTPPLLAPVAVVFGLDCELKFGMVGYVSGWMNE